MQLYLPHFAKELPLILSMFCLPSLSIAQTNLTFKGKVIERHSNSPIPFATVGIRKSGIGVNSNEVGEFIFHIPILNINDTIDISCLGYLKAKIPVDLVVSDKIQTIELTPNAIAINDVIIKGKATPLKAKDIVFKSIQHITDNFPVEPFQLTGYYRDYLKENNVYYNLTEAALSIDDKGFQSNDYDETIYKLIQFRTNPKFRIDESSILSYDNKNKYIPNATMVVRCDNEFTILRIHDPVRNFQHFSFSFMNVFNSEFITNHNFKLKKTTFIDSIPVYMIEIDAMHKVRNKPTDIIFWSSGFIFINAKTFAIEKLSYLIEINSDDFSGKLLELNVEYKEFNNKMYLNYLSFSNYFKLAHVGSWRFRDGIAFKSSGDSNETLYQYREFFVNQVSGIPYKKISKSESFPKNQTFRLNSIKPDSVFWDSFNYIQRPLQ